MAVTNSAPKSQMEAMQTVTRHKETDPRVTRQVLIADPIGSVIFQGCLGMILYYNKHTENDSGLMVAGWIRESLERALVDQPLLSGRLCRGEDGNGKLEIVSKDSGIRLIETRIPVTLKDFLDVKEQNKLESELVFWKDVDEQNPQFSLLLYVQVTNFQCGGYSIGISCSLLVAYIFIMDDFLSKWENTHSDMMPENDSVTQTPIFYHPNLKPSTFPLPTSIINSIESKIRIGKTMIFKVVGESIRSWEHEPCKKLAAVCIEEAECKLGNQIPSEFSSFVYKSQKLIKLEN